MQFLTCHKLSGDGATSAQLPYGTAGMPGLSASGFLPQPVPERPPFQPYAHFPAMWHPQEAHHSMGLPVDGMFPRPLPPSTSQRLGSFPPWVVTAPQFKRKYKDPWCVSNDVLFRRYVVESISSTRSDITRHAFRQNTDHFIIDDDKNVLVASGPRKTYCKDAGFIYVFGATKGGSSDTIVSVGDSITICDEYANWMRRKLKHRSEIRSTNRVVNIIGQVDVPHDCLELDLYDLYSFVTVAFPQWRVAYDPEIAPTLAICRVNCRDASVGRKRRRAASDERLQENEDVDQHQESTDARTTEAVAAKEPTGDDSASSVLSDASKSASVDTPETAPPKETNQVMSTDLPMAQQLNASGKADDVQETTSKTESHYTDQYETLPVESPLEALAQWMLTEETRAFSTARRAFTTDQQPIELPKCLWKDSPLYTHLPGWMKCTFIVTPKAILVHHAQTDKDLETAWLNFFPLLRYFLSRVSDIPATPTAGLSGLPPPSAGFLGPSPMFHHLALTTATPATTNHPGIVQTTPMLFPTWGNPAFHETKGGSAPTALGMERIGVGFHGATQADSTAVELGQRQGSAPARLDVVGGASSSLPMGPPPPQQLLHRAPMPPATAYRPL